MTEANPLTFIAVCQRRLQILSASLRITLASHRVQCQQFGPGEGGEEFRLPDSAEGGYKSWREYEEAGGEEGLWKSAEAEEIHAEEAVMSLYRR